MWQPTQFSARELSYAADTLEAHRLLLRRPRLVSEADGWLMNTVDTAASADAAVRSALPHVPRAVTRLLLASDLALITAASAPIEPAPAPTSGLVAASESGNSLGGLQARQGQRRTPTTTLSARCRVVRHLLPSRSRPAHDGGGSLTLELRLTGGGDSDDEDDGDYGGMACTQAVGYDGGLLDDEPRLVPIVDGRPDDASSVELPTSPGVVFSIGRKPTSTLKLIDDEYAHEPRVHSEHATITLTESGAYELKLVGKGMATFVNEVPLYHISLPGQSYEQPPVLLKDGDTLRFGGMANANYSKFVFMVYAADAEQPDREVTPLVAAPAIRPKPKPARRPVLPTPTTSAAAPTVAAPGVRYPRGTYAPPSVRSSMGPTRGRPGR